MNGNYSVIYTPKATDDLLGIYSYIAFNLKAPRSAEGQVNRIRKEIRSLSFMPSRHGGVDWEPWESMGMHKVSVDHFAVYYAIDNDNNKVIVIRIFYAGRDVEGVVNAARE